MEATSLLRMVASLGLVLGTLVAALWAVRRFDVRLPGRSSAAGRIALIERLSLDPKRSVVLIRRDGCEHLLLIAPEGTLAIETAIRQPKRASTSASKRDMAVTQHAPVRQGRSFASLLEQHLDWPVRFRQPRADLTRNVDACAGE